MSRPNYDDVAPLLAEVWTLTGDEARMALWRAVYDGRVTREQIAGAQVPHCHPERLWWSMGAHVGHTLRSANLHRRVRS